VELKLDQKIAIETQGNVLLSAGAGSGKTFVIIEHLLYRISLILDQVSNDEDQERELVLKLRKIALMTFTTKAAGEIKHRLKKRINEKKENDPNWINVYENIDQIFVGTIHSFCLRLLSLNIISGWSKERFLYDESEYAQVIKKILDRWYEKSIIRPDIAQLLKRKKDVEKSVISIFSDANLRVLWDEGNQSEIDFLSFFEQMSILKNWNIDPCPDDLDDSSWSLFVRVFYESRGSIEKINEWAKERLPRLPKKMDYADLHGELKSIKSFFKSNGEGLALYYSKNEEAHEWKKRLFDIYSFVKLEYQEELGVNYGDLEYLCFEGLKVLENQKKVSEFFDYFIIDEFQDTSSLQFQIILNAAQGDYQKVFCVGDLKQAIYGFRGGDVEVFKSVNERVKHPLELEHNFRSKSNITKFNNEIFELVLDLDKKLYKKQKTLSEASEGRVKLIKSSISDDLSSAEKNKLESSLIIEWIKKNREKNIAVLYRKLSPSHYLIKDLIKENIGFTAQLKVKLIDDPIIGVFYLFLERYLNKSDISNLFFEKKCLIYEKNLFLSNINWHEAYDKFINNINLLGVLGSWLEVIYNLNLSVSSGEKNIQYLRNIIISQSGNLESIYQRIKEGFESDYSMDFQWGDHAQLINIMTVHASKGLEFNHVVLAGIHTNSKMSYQKPQVGKEPNSYLWFEKLKKKSWMTPSYYIENEKEKIKQKSESKRLLYVACTRAVKEVIFVNSQDISIDGDNWINYLHLGLQGYKDLSVEEISFSGVKIDFNLKVQAPLHYLDNLGVVGIEDNKRSLLKIMPELNVTAFASLKLCQKKFYFDYILKMNDSMINYYEKVLKIEKDEPLEDLPKSISNKWRGTKIHGEIESWLKNETEEPEYGFMNWLKSFIKPSLDNLMIEYSLKFSLFGQTIEGRIDIMIEEEDKVRLIDLKTGRFDKVKESSYITQLKLYAYAVLKNKLFSDKLIQIEILYLDEQKQIIQKIDSENLENELWKDLFYDLDFTKENLDYCTQCEYNSFCRL